MPTLKTLRPATPAPTSLGVAAHNTTTHLGTQNTPRVKRPQNMAGVSKPSVGQKLGSLYDTVAGVVAHKGLPLPDVSPTAVSPPQPSLATMAPSLPPPTPPLTPPASTPPPATATGMAAPAPANSGLGKPYSVAMMLADKPEMAADRLIGAPPEARRGGRPGWNSQYQNLEAANNPRMFDQLQEGARQPTGYSDTGISGGLVSPTYAMSPEQTERERSAMAQLADARNMQETADPAGQSAVMAAIGQGTLGSNFKPLGISADIQGQQWQEAHKARNLAESVRMSRVQQNEAGKANQRRERMAWRQAEPNPLANQLMANPQLMMQYMGLAQRGALGQGELANRDRALDIREQEMLNAGNVTQADKTGMLYGMISQGIPPNVARDRVAQITGESSGAGSAAPGGSPQPNPADAEPFELQGVSDDELQARAASMGYQPEQILRWIQRRKGIEPRQSATLQDPDGIGFWDVLNPFNKRPGMSGWKQLGQWWRNE